MKPLLAVEADLDKVKFPVAVSAKLDGIRMIVKDGVCLSRKLKPIPNLYVQARFKHLEGYDGELILGEPTAPDVFRKTTSAVMSIAGEPDVTFFAFDHLGAPDKPWVERFARIVMQNNVVKLRHRLASTLRQVRDLEEEWLAEGYEGLMLRDIYAPYKFGRSTQREGILLKLKKFADAEFEIVGFAEREHNGNEATVDELGHTKRSSHQENKTGRGDLGALVLAGDGFTFSCGTGFDDQQRAELWERRDTLIGKWAKVKYFEVGVKTAPRFPVFLGIRDERDM